MQKQLFTLVAAFVYIHMYPVGRGHYRESAVLFARRILLVSWSWPFEKICCFVGHGHRVGHGQYCEGNFLVKLLWPLERTCCFVELGRLRVAKFGQFSPLRSAQLQQFITAEDLRRISCSVTARDLHRISRSDISGILDRMSCSATAKDHHRIGCSDTIEIFTESAA